MILSKIAGFSFKKKLKYLTIIQDMQIEILKSEKILEIALL